jgi:hypothetical protein
MTVGGALGEILIAVVTGFLIPALSAMWLRRHKSHPEVAESLVLGLLILAAAIASFYFVSVLPSDAGDEVLTPLLLLFKVVLFLFAVYGGLIGVFIMLVSFKGFFEGTKGE